MQIGPTLPDVQEQAHVTVWTDYLCPWCWIAQRRIEWLGERAELELRPLEIHPELPTGGSERAALPRSPAGIGDRLRALADAEEVPLRFPDRVPNTRLAHRAGEWVRARDPDAFASFHTSLFAAYWLDGEDLGDVDVLAEHATRVGVPGVDLASALEDGAGATELLDAHRDAEEVGAVGTPAFLVRREEATLLVPGLQPVELFERILARLGRRA